MEEKTKVLVVHAWSYQDGVRGDSVCGANWLNEAELAATIGEDHEHQFCVVCVDGLDEEED